ncbi:MAG TPA: recombinase family protein [Desulfitobacteriaceae bacterium]|nr:recombinase family protein [Desulfitobacteriaceae bacterium]
MQTKAFGYVRVSCKDQNVDRQVKDMLAIGINERDIFSDKQSGKDFNRPMYKVLKSYLRQGDKLYVKALDRFGRNKEQILEEWRSITKEIGADIIVMDMPLLDSSKYKEISGLETLITDIVLQLLSYFAEEERSRLKTRQAEGIFIAKRKGVKFGRPSIEYPPEWDYYYNLWKQGKATAVETFTRLNLKKATFYKLVRKYEGRWKN